MQFSKGIHNRIYLKHNLTFRLKLNFQYVNRSNLMQRYQFLDFMMMIQKIDRTVSV